MSYHHLHDWCSIKSHQLGSNLRQFQKKFGVRMDIVLSKYAKMRLFQTILVCIAIKLTRIRLHTLDMSHKQS